MSVLDAVPGVDLLRCPTCAGPIDRETIFMCGRCGRHYNVEEGIPRMLDETVPGVAEKAREAEGWASMARAQGWYEPDDSGRCGAPVRLPRPRLGRRQLARERALVLAAAAEAAPGDAGARGRRGEVLGRASRDGARAARTSARTSSPTGRSGSVAASSTSARPGRSCVSRPTARACRSPTAPSTSPTAWRPCTTRSTSTAWSARWRA